MRFPAFLGNRGPAPLYWTVWRTTSEILALHGNAHSAMGDLAPRRPRLKSTIKQAADLTNAELLADMRSVAGMPIIVSYFGD